MKVLLTEFRQESNSFNPAHATLEFWRQNGEYEGDAVRERFTGDQSAIGGMLHAVSESPRHPDVVYGIVMSCQSGGVAEQEVMDHYLERLLPAIEASLPLDGVFISFHGALLTTDYDDPEAEITRRVRALVGDATIITISTDLHAYISADLVRNVDAICGYQTYPHVDHFETGHRAASIGLDAIARGAKPVTAWVPIPMIVPAASYNSLGGAFKEVIDHGHEMRANGRIIDFTVYQMQPWFDIPDPNSSAVVIANDRESAAAAAIELADMLYSRRHEFHSDLASIDEVISLTTQPDTVRPVILVDAADSCNAGAAGDNMAVAERLLTVGRELRSATVVNDAPAARKAHELGVGATATFSLGGTRSEASITVQAEGRVKSLHDGQFRQEGPAGRGVLQDIGRTAVISFGSLDVVVCEWMAGNGDPQLFRAHGIEPTLYDLVAVKASTSFRAGYRAFAGTIVDTDTPGAATSNLQSLPFTRLPQTIYPWTDNPAPHWAASFAHPEQATV